MLAVAIVTVQEGKLQAAPSSVFHNAIWQGLRALAVLQLPSLLATGVGPLSSPLHFLSGISLERRPPPQAAHALGLGQVSSGSSLPANPFLNAWLPPPAPVFLHAVRAPRVGGLDTLPSRPTTFNPPHAHLVTTGPRFPFSAQCSLCPTLFTQDLTFCLSRSSPPGSAPPNPYL